MNSFDLNEVSTTDGFIADKMQINENISVYAVYNRFKETGRFDALKCIKKGYADIFWDSDVAKWLEAVAYILAKKDDKTLKQYFDEAINDIIANQLDNGYFNSHFQVYEPQNIFKRRTDHELYCAGHLFEAAVAAKKYLNDDRLLNFSNKYCKYLKERFIIKKDTAFITPGHEEIELALYKLYKLTNDSLYKELGEFYLFNRGKQKEDIQDWAKDNYNQSHLPVYEQKKATGHAVRALYLYIAMADYAKENNDNKLKDSCISLFNDIITKKMYITGGVGSSHCGEAFTIPYDLPNNTAYAETCASIALAFFADRLIKLDNKAIYGDIFERVLYNGLLSGVSHDGKSFFYVNPLSVDVDRTTYHESNKDNESLPIIQRKEVFDCSCCPPNINRFIEEIPQYIYYTKNDSLYIYQYISSILDNNDLKIKMDSNFPYDGKVKIEILKNVNNKIIKLRKPSWCKHFKTNFKYKEENSFIIVLDNTKQLEIDFEMKLKEVYTNSNVAADIRKIALSYGPLIMCAEGTDNDFNFISAKIDTKNYKIEKGEYFKIVVLAKIIDKNKALYFYTKPNEKKVNLTLIPYFEWANRKRNSMRVFFYK